MFRFRYTVCCIGLPANEPGRAYPALPGMILVASPCGFEPQFSDRESDVLDRTRRWGHPVSCLALAPAAPVPSSGHDFHPRRQLAARQGFEPQLPDPESGVLPLDDRATPSRDSVLEYNISGRRLKSRAPSAQGGRGAGDFRAVRTFPVSNLE